MIEPLNICHELVPSNDLSAGTADNKWVSVKQVNPLNSFKVGDIIFSGRDIESETNGKWALCDGRAYLTSAKPTLYNNIGHLYGMGYTYKTLLDTPYTSKWDSYSWNGSYSYFEPKLIWYMSNGSYYIGIERNFYYSEESHVAYSIAYVNAAQNRVSAPLSSLSPWTNTQDFAFSLNDKLYYGKINFGNDKFIYILDNTGAVKSINVTSTFTNVNREEFIGAFIYTGLTYIVLSENYDNRSNKVHLVKINSDNTVLYTSIGSFRKNTGDPGPASFFNYSNNKIYFNFGYTYNMATSQFSVETFPAQLKGINGPFNIDACYCNNGKHLEWGGTKYVDLTTFNVTSLDLKNDALFYKVNGKWQQIRKTRYEQTQYSSNWYANRYAENYDRTVPQQCRIDVRTPIGDQNTINNRYNTSYFIPATRGIINFDTVNYIPVSGLGIEYNSSNSKWNNYASLAIFQIDKNKLLLPVSTYDEKNTRNGYMKTE